MPEYLRKAAVVLAFLALCLTNVLTLTNSSFHIEAHDLFESAFGGVVPTADSMTNRTKALRAENEKLKVANEGLVIEVRRVVAAEAALRATYQALELAHDLLRTRTLRLVDDTHRLIAEHNQLSQKSTAQKAAAKQLSGRVFPRLTKAVGRNVSSLVPRAVPWVGISVSVAITTLDVIDACDTLKDLNALNEAIEEAKHDDSKVCGVKIPSVEEVMKSVPRH